MRRLGNPEKESPATNNRLPMANFMNLPKFLRQFSISKWVVPLLLVGLIAVGALPNYLQGRWTWTTPPEVTHLKPLQELAQRGIALPGWKTVSQQEIKPGAGRWLMQELEADGREGVSDRLDGVTLLLRPQTSPTGTSAQPQMEWTDLNFMGGARGWKTDSYQWLRFDLPSDGGETHQSDHGVEARFFRGWNPQQTYAILQWYAWSGGGHANLNRWFWVDRRAQLSQQRMPWVAVSVMIEIEPLGDIEEIRPLAESLGQQVQTALMAEALHP